jgi:hypothetical protein
MALLRNAALYKVEDAIDALMPWAYNLAAQPEIASIPEK